VTVCTTIAAKLDVRGSAKAMEWFAIHRAYVSYDHPFDAPFEHTLNLDFVYEFAPVRALFLELEAKAARALARAILDALERGGE
jgi:hypothetical protein